MLAYILVIILTGSSVTTAEFLDKDRCERAAQAIVQSNPRYTKAYCFQK